MCTLTEWLRGRSDAELRQLLVERPDLASPVPADLAALAERATTQASVTRALDRLDHATLQVLEALAVLADASEPVAHTELFGALPSADAESVRSAVSTLRTLALVWDHGAAEALWVVPAVRAVITRRAGLGPPAGTVFADMNRGRLRDLLGDLGLGDPGVAPEAGGAASTVAAYLAKPDALDDLLTAAGADARAVLDRLTWGPPVGTIANARRDVRLATATSPIERLLARGLLAPAGGGTVVLPREVALHLRGGLLFRSIDPPPPLEVRDHAAHQVEQTAAGQAFAAVRAVEGLLELWGADPPAVLRAGGLGVRELRRTARDLNVTEKHAATYIEVAYAAGLLAVDSGIDGEWAPTKAYDIWRAQSPQQRWFSLASAWLDSARVPGLVGERGDRNKAINALGPEAERPGAGEMRREVLGVLATLQPDSSASEESLRARLAWLRPRRWEHSRDQWLRWTLEEAETLGVTGLGSLPAYGRALLSGGDADAAAVLAPLIPEPVDHVLAQPDLTVVAPGPLTRELDRELALAADVESTGGATVFRFTQNSVRRALDAGRSAGDLLTLLDRHSRTPVPQPLRYLVEDVARAHGRIRVGTASAYIRCDDPGTLTELLADRRAARLGLRRLADTVLASRTGQQELVERLRALGYAPMAESAEGELLIARSSVRRAESHARPPGVPAGQQAQQPAAGERLATAAVRALRAGDRAATAARRPLGQSGVGGDVAAGTDSGAHASPAGPNGRAATPRSSATSTVAALRSAAGDGQPLWIGYLDAQGQASSRIVEPARVEGGFLTAYDSTREAVHRFALHRITGVALLDEGPG